MWNYIKRFLGMMLQAKIQFGDLLPFVPSESSETFGFLYRHHLHTVMMTYIYICSNFSISDLEAVKQIVKLLW